MPSRYTFTDYSPDWPAAFEREAAALAARLGDALIVVHHIGSTSVPGLPAKPVIDLIPVVRDIHALDRGTLEQAGYHPWGEYGLPGRRLFTKDSGAFRTHNLHCYQQGDAAVERHLAFCAFLRSHADVRDEYAAMKRAVYAEHPADIAAYSAGKDAWIKRVERQAIAWYAARRHPLG